MESCLFCGVELQQGDNFCPRCGISALLALPYHPQVQHYNRLLFLSMTGILSGLLACVLAYLQTVIPFFVLLLILSVTVSGLILETCSGKMDTKYLRVLALIGISLSAIAYLLTIVLNPSLSVRGSYF